MVTSLKDMRFVHNGMRFGRHVDDKHGNSKENMKQNKLYIHLTLTALLSVCYPNIQLHGRA